MSRKIYFCGSIRGGRQDVELYARIIKQLQSYGTVLTEHVGGPMEVIDKALEEKGDKYIHDRDMEWLESSDVIIAEVTQPSLGVGYEIGRAFAMEKNIMCLFRPSSGKYLSAMIGGMIGRPNIVIKNYEEKEVPGILQEYFANI
ncbi:5-hydroxymethyl-dUMP N-hydrolase-like [Glandiceps talaboti]